VSLQVLEVNIGTVRKGAGEMSKSSDMDDQEAMTATFYVLDERFKQLQKDVSDTVKHLKVLSNSYWIMLASLSNVLR